MSFKTFRDDLKNHFEKMTESVDIKSIFMVDGDPDELYELYLNSFPTGTNEVFRERREHDCSACKHFIRTFGNVVVLSNNKMESIWDVDTKDDTYNTVCKSLSHYVKQHKVKDVFLTYENRIGLPFSNEFFDNGLVYQWQHLFVDIPNKFRLNRRENINEVVAQKRDIKNVFKRSLDEITLESANTVMELINQGSLYRGEEWKSIIQTFITYKELYEKVSNTDKDNFAWEKSIDAVAIVGKIRNHSIGTLLVNISHNMDLDEAVRKYEAIVAPTNYKRPKPIFTKRMLEDAKKTITDLGYADSLKRRYATIDDITVNNILFADRNTKNRMGSMDVFDELEHETAINPKVFSKVEEVKIEDFVNNILPSSQEIEVFLENKHRNNFVSLIAPEIKDSKTMFKWNNNFSWAYSGNITDSNIKKNVKAAGGNVNGYLRFSIQWNDDDYNPNDFDAHCLVDMGRRKNHIYYANKSSSFAYGSSEGSLDVDIVYPNHNIPAVENIIFPHKDKLQLGIYSFYVNCYCNNGGKSGFKAEIEMDGQVFQYEYSKSLRTDETIKVVDVKYDGEKLSLVKEYLKSETSSIDVWGLKTNQFIPVNTIMYSPNYWDEQNGIGNKHYFFMLKDCQNTENPNGFYNEFLKEELMKHKKVFEALGSKLAVVDSKDQLSGLGFSSTQRNELIVKVTGNMKRTLKIKF